MFSHSVHNPNNLEIKKDNYYAIPFGHRCTSALACKFAGVRKSSLPFDWCAPLFPGKIKKVLENNFDNFVPNVHKRVFINKYNFVLAHFNNDINKGVEEYKRRISRFKDIMNEKNKTLYFVYINEDYLYDDNYRKNSFNDMIFKEMLDLESFLKKKYPHIDYNILHFNFKKHNIPKDSKIINIVLKTSNYTINVVTV